MSNYIKLINNLEVLQLEKIKQNLDQYVDLINNKKKDVVESLYELTNLEIELRNEKAINYHLSNAHYTGSRSAKHVAISEPKPVTRGAR